MIILLLFRNGNKNCGYDYSNRTHERTHMWGSQDQTGCKYSISKVRYCHIITGTIYFTTHKRRQLIIKFLNLKIKNTTTKYYQKS